MKYCKHCGVGAAHSDSAKKCAICGGTEFVQHTYRSATPQKIPKCPTCGSTNIRRITATERGMNAVMFGVFGTKRKCQFECQNQNCKYRW